MYLLSEGKQYTCATNSVISPMLPTLFLAHGGGPLPILGDAAHAELSSSLRGIPAKHLKMKPRHIIVISAHWESDSRDVVQISTGNSNGELLYDYYGFPPQAYAPHLTYNVKGSLELATKTSKVLSNSFEKVEIVNRGFDHGVFVPLKLMFPQAEIPVIQVSLIGGLDPSNHIKLGKALSELREGDRDTLIVGSGMSFHNMQAFRASGGINQNMQKSLAFHEYLRSTIEGVGPPVMLDRLASWEQAPEARFCHPREEHLLPLHVAAAAAGANARGQTIYDGTLMGVKVASFLFRPSQ